MATTVADDGGVMFVPAFTGWGTPHWNPEARGLIIGLTRDSRPGHLARAALEGIALSVATLVNLAEQAIGHNLRELAVDGGAAASDPLLQAQADSTGLKVRRPASLESTARGVALLAGVQCGLVSEIHQLSRSREVGAQLFSPQLDSQARKRWLERWDNAVRRSLDWASEPSSS